MKNSIAFPLMALTAMGGVMAEPYCRVLIHKKVAHHTKVVHAKPKPPVEVIRYVSSPCVPMGIQTPPVNTAFAPINDSELPGWLGVTHYPTPIRIDYGYPVNGGQIIPLPPTPPIPVGSASVPEPASWAMMVAGFGIVGGVMRRRKGAWA